MIQTGIVGVKKCLLHFIEMHSIYLLIRQQQMNPNQERERT